MTYFWFRRDLRLQDNTALFKALSSDENVQPIFIFDENILSELEEDDPRVNFIYDELHKINAELNKYNSSLLVFKGNPVDIWKSLIAQNNVQAVYFNHDYEPYARERDKAIFECLKANNIEIRNFKDQVIFEKGEVLKNDGNPYTIFTPYKNKWLQALKEIKLTINQELPLENLVNQIIPFPNKSELGIKESHIKVKPYSLTELEHYDSKRNFPSEDAGSYLSPHLRFGTVSVRELVKIASKRNNTFLSELIWREFFMQIIWHFPDSVTQNFKRKYDAIQWRNNEQEFEKWCNGKTGYPIVDAGIRELNSTGYMHNRVRMITASFLVKHLLIDWRWGEAYFAKKLLDFELSSNVGNWQWVAGTGCDAAPYFRVFNPFEQVKKFDKDYKYIKQWVPEFETASYPKPIVEHKFARERAIATYKAALS